MRHLEHDRLIQLAASRIGNGGAVSRTPDEAAHLSSCVDCSASLEEIHQTFALADLKETPRLADPPDEVWQRIAAATDSPPVGTTGVRARSRAGHWVAAAAAVIGCLVGVGATVIVSSSGPGEPAAVDPVKPEVVATAALSVPAGSGGVTADPSGTGRLVREDGRWTLLVDTRGLTPQGGYFEVWLLDATGRMYALGALPEDSTAQLAVPEGISIAQFNIVDISAQQFNGDPRHSSDSVLRGVLRT